MTTFRNNKGDQITGAEFVQLLRDEGKNDAADMWERKIGEAPAPAVREPDPDPVETVDPHEEDVAADVDDEITQEVFFDEKDEE